MFLTGMIPEGDDLPEVCLDGEAPLPEPNLRLLPAGVLR